MIVATLVALALNPISFGAAAFAKVVVLHFGSVGQCWTDAGGKKVDEWDDPRFVSEFLINVREVAES